MFSKTFESTLDTVWEYAKTHDHEFITVEHLLLSLLDNPEASNVLVACGSNVDRLRAGLSIFLDETTPRIPQYIQRDIQPTLSFQRVLARAIYQVQSTNRPEVTGTHVLTAIFGEQDSQSVYFLNQENITRIDVVNYLTQGITRYQQSADASSFEDSSIPDATFSTSAPPAEDSVVDMYAINLNERAIAGKLDPVIGRDHEMQRAIQILCRRNKNNPLFVGEAGVGKTAIAEGLAQMIVAKQVPDNLRYSTIYSLDLGTMLAGTKYRGDFEKRFKTVLKALSSHSGAIVFFDEIHNLVGAGSATGGTMDAANLIKPMLSTGELRCMGATTYEEYRNFIAKDQALLRRFQKVDIEEPSKEHTLNILNGLKERFESYHGVSYSDKALLRTVELAERYLPDRKLPDKAIDIIDEAGAMQQAKVGQRKRRNLTERDIEQVMAKMTRIPLDQLSSSDKQILKSMPQKLQQMVFGQNQAVTQLCDAIKLSRAGLRDHNKPVGSFLMAGPTGVGKTELTRQLAENMGVELLRFDMSEYMERHAVSRLIGAPPGYVGYDQGGLLTEAAIRHPHAVLLLDEIEKAHPDMFNILLQIMDYGMLTDNNGRKADFRHVIIIMTTNVGAELLERNVMGFGEQDNSSDSLVALKGMFTPEFRNRLDAVIQFKHLDEDVILKIVDKNIKEMQKQLGDKDIKLTLTTPAKRWLVEHGYDRNMGARPMERLIQEKIKKPLAEEILFGRFVNGSGRVQVSVESGDLVVNMLSEVGQAS
jgi:ATP-dependent Clp protease ATP-binding subunit ClpA